ncbi:hypothetical protein FUAX_18660 [Fulvitalea axinellae]|uniref:DUF4857 domain-containing protein n=1 Tax=Fulvitalea axinellae TaxID=1182444 RepID=A0AAU9CBE9_9BACT|nr:hypothetical protein FUAX_18660 [Fulvitalea axinellae]
MNGKIGKYALVSLAIIVLAWYLPYFFNLLFKENIRPPYPVYSAIKQDYYFFNRKGPGIVDKKGNEFSIKQADSLLPLFYYRQLYAQGKMPDSVQGIAMTPSLFKAKTYMTRLKAKDYDRPEIKLYPLFETVLKRGKLTMPNDVFRIGKKMEFIDCQSNTINEKKSEQFTQTLKKSGFTFPADMIVGNPSARKPYDWGYFVLDQKGELFRIWMRKGKAFCRHIKKADNMSEIARLVVTEHSSKRFFATILDSNGKVFHLSAPTYKWERLPIDPINPKTDDISINGNPLYHLVRVINNNEIKAYAIKQDYSLENSYSIRLDKWEDKNPGKLKSYIFPFVLSSKKEGSDFVNFHFKKFAWSSIWVNLFFAILFFLTEKKQCRHERYFGFALCCLFGIYALIPLKVLVL